MDPSQRRRARWDDRAALSALQSKVAPASPTGRVLADLSRWRCFFLMGSFMRAECTFSPPQAHAFESQVPGEMVYSPEPVKTI